MLIPVVTLVEGDQVARTWIHIPFKVSDIAFSIKEEGLPETGSKFFTFFVL